MKLPVRLQVELSQRVGMAIQTLRQLRKQGRIPAFKNGVYTEADVAAILKCKEKAKKKKRRLVTKALRALWKDPDYVQRTTRAIVRGSNTPEAKEAKRVAALASWPERQKQLRAGITPKTPKKISEALKRWHRQHPERADEVSKESAERHAQQKAKLAEAERILAAAKEGKLLPFTPFPEPKKSSKPETDDKIDLAGRLLTEGHTQSSMRFFLFPDQRSTPEAAYANTRRLFCDHREQIEAAKNRYLSAKQASLTDVS